MPTRRAKIEALLKEHLPPAPVRRAAATKFEVQFYQDLVTYNVPLEPALRERGYVVGRVYMMYGGTDLSAGSEACLELGRILNGVGLQMVKEGDGASTICK